MNTHTTSDSWWVVSISEFLNALPKELRDNISYFLTFKARHIADIFRKEVLANCHAFKLYAIETEIHSGSPLLYRPFFRTVDSWHNDGRDGSVGWSVDFRTRIEGSCWDFSGQQGFHYHNDNWFQGKQAVTPLRYIRGSPVPLWWIRHESVEFRSPFYSFGSRFYHCSAICYQESAGACRTLLPPSHQTLCRCRWIEDIVWGTGPDPAFVDEYIAQSEQQTSTRFQHDELSYRKNMGSMATCKYGCECHDTIFYTQPEWHLHQVQNPTKDCPICIEKLRNAFGEDAHRYSAKCVYTRPKTMYQFVDKIGWTSQPPVLKKHLSFHRKKERKERNQHKKKRLNRRLTKMPGLVYNS